MKDNLNEHERIVLNIAEKGSSTRTHNLDLALEKAKDRFAEQYRENELITKIVFNIQNPYLEPLLNIADYLCWAVQRVFEKGEDRYYHLIKSKITLVVDLYDTENYANFGNYYDNVKNPLTVKNKISPHLP